MREKRYLLFSARSLLGEIIEQTLAQVEGLALAGHFPVDEDLVSRVECQPADLVVITGEGLDHAEVSRLTGLILDRFPDLPVFHITLQENQVQVFCSHLLPAGQADLIASIQELPWRDQGAEPE